MTNLSDLVRGSRGFQGYQGNEGAGGSFAWSTEVSSATPTINTDAVQAHSITALATNITDMSVNVTGTPTNFQRLVIRIKDDGTIRDIFDWGLKFEPKGVPLPAFTIAGKVMTVLFMFDSITNKWGCIGLAIEQ